MSSYRSLAPEIEKIRNRLRAMRAEREAVMDRLASSREHAETNRQVRADSGANPTPPGSPSSYAG